MGSVQGPRVRSRLDWEEPLHHLLHRAHLGWRAQGQGRGQREGGRQGCGRWDSPSLARSAARLTRPSSASHSSCPERRLGSRCKSPCSRASSWADTGEQLTWAGGRQGSGCAGAGEPPLLLQNQPPGAQGSWPLQNNQNVGGLWRSVCGRKGPGGRLPRTREHRPLWAPAHLVEQAGEHSLVATHVQAPADTQQFLLILRLGLLEGLQLDQQVRVFQCPGDRGSLSLQGCHGVRGPSPQGCCGGPDITMHPARAAKSGSGLLQTLRSAPWSPAHTAFLPHTPDSFGGSTLGSLHQRMQGLDESSGMRFQGSGGGSLPGNCPPYRTLTAAGSAGPAAADLEVQWGSGCGRLPGPPHPPSSSRVPVGRAHVPRPRSYPQTRRAAGCGCAGPRDSR